MTLKVKMHRIVQGDDLLERAEKLGLPDDCQLALIDGQWAPAFRWVREYYLRRGSSDIRSTAWVLINAHIIEEYEVEVQE